MQDILLDTGCTRTMVRVDLVTPEKVLEDAVEIQCAHGDGVWYPLANVEMQVEGLEIEVEAAISEKLPVAVLLGKDVPEFTKLLRRKRGSSEVGEQQGGAMTVVERVQACQELEEGLSLRGKGLTARPRQNLDLVDELEARKDGAEQAGVTTLLSDEKFQQCKGSGDNKHPPEICVVGPQDTNRGFTEDAEAENRKQSSADVDFGWENGPLNRSCPLRRSKAGMERMLMLCYHATRYPEMTFPWRAETERALSFGNIGKNHYRCPISCCNKLVCRWRRGVECEGVG